MDIGTSHAMVALTLLVAAVLAGGCRGGETVAIDGSSTVSPLSEAVAEEYGREHRTRVTIAVSGTGGGFKKFCAGEVVIAGASRAIKPSEIAQCERNGIEYLELPVAYDGVAVVVNRENDFVDHLTVEELARIWAPGSRITDWSQVRPGFPSVPLRLYGAGVDSGTYDYFTLAVVGREHASRGDFTSSENDNVLVQGVAGDKGALGFFGYAYYAENTNKLKLVPIDDGDPSNGDGPIAPTPQTVADGTYQPLSRPIFIYVSRADAEGEAVDGFIDFYLEQAGTLAPEVGYIALPPESMALVRARYEARTTGSLFDGAGSRVGVTVQQLLSEPAPEPTERR